MDDNRIILQSSATPRANLEDAFTDAVGLNEEPESYFANNWDDEEWTWYHHSASI